MAPQIKPIDRLTALSKVEGLKKRKSQEKIKKLSYEINLL